MRKTPWGGGREREDKWIEKGVGTRPYRDLTETPGPLSGLHFEHTKRYLDSKMQFTKWATSVTIDGLFLQALLGLQGTPAR